jgi:flagellar biosynthetic protein FliR
MVGHETMIGLSLGLTLRFVFEGMQLAGQILGFQLGFSLVNIIDPQTQVDTPLLSIFTQLITMLMFLQLEIHHWLLRGLASSFEYLPMGTGILPNAIPEMVQAAGGIFVIAVQISAPIIVATFLADIAVGFLAKASPQLPVLFLAIPAKSLVGYAVIISTAPFWLRSLERHFTTAVESMESFLRLAN